jgi:Rps23 Pro-64 3,4-dihydroxylase Tpa1-like proline 4-hydroxylase
VLNLQTQDMPGSDEAGPFRINRELDVAALSRTYEVEGRVRVENLLEQGPLELLDYFQRSRDWIHVINTEDGVLELDRDDKAAMSPEQWSAVEAQAHERARHGFQYRYEALRVPEQHELSQERDLMAEFARLMGSGAMVDLLRAITGTSGLAFTDGQATAYGPGDFLTGHDDDVAGKGRIAAYVYGLTPGWRIEWGGLLLFHGERERSAAALAPRFNTLDLFAVPQQHSVSLVTPAAAHRRFAVTGWLRGSR